MQAAPAADGWKHAAEGKHVRYLANHQVFTRIMELEAGFEILEGAGF
jgi:hypothetical protein